MYEVKIQDLAEAKALTTPHKGPYMQIGSAFDHLAEWFLAHNAFRPGMRLIAIYYDDPSAVPESELRSCAGVILPEGDQITTPFEETWIRGGAYAVLQHKGPYSELPRAYEWLYGQWLPNSGRQAGHAPVFEEYLNTPRDTPPAELLTNICLPLLAS